MNRRGQAPISVGRAGVLYACWLGIVILSTAWVPYTLVQSYWIHNYYDHDSDIGFATWDFHFDGLQVTAILLVLLAAASVWLTQAVTAPLRTSAQMAALLAASVLLNVCVVVAARRSASIWNGGPNGDPSGWLDVAAVALALQLIGAAIAGVLAVTRAGSTGSVAPSATQDVTA